MSEDASAWLPVLEDHWTTTTAWPWEHVALPEPAAARYMRLVTGGSRTVDEGGETSGTTGGETSGEFHLAEVQFALAAEPDSSSDPDLLTDSAQWLVRYYGFDGAGSVRYLTDPAGLVTDTWEYDAFGNLLARTGSTENTHLYQGQQFDPDLGLYYLRARWYNPSTGRMWTRDPFEGILSEPGGLNKYAYANANPASYGDPSGHWGTSLFELTQDFGLWAQANRRIDSGWSRDPMDYGSALGQLYGPSSGLMLTAVEQRAPDKVHKAWVGASEGWTVGGLVGEANQIETFWNEPGTESMNAVPLQRFFAAAGMDDISSLVERNVERSQLAISSLRASLNTNGVLDRQSGYSRYDNLNRWLETQYHDGLFKALQVGGDPMSGSMEISIYPAHLHRGAGVASAFGPTASAMKTLRPEMGLNPGGRFYQKVRYLQEAGLESLPNSEWARLMEGPGWPDGLNGADLAPVYGSSGDLGTFSYHASAAFAEGDYLRGTALGAVAALSAGAAGMEAFSLGTAKAATLPVMAMVKSGARNMIRKGVTTVAGDVAEPAVRQEMKASAFAVRGTIRNAMQREGISRSDAARMVREGRLCFVAGTQVRTEWGARDIAEIRAGERVWSRCDRTGEEGWKRVARTFVSRPTTLVHLTYRRSAGREGREGKAAGRASTGGERSGGEGGRSGDDDGGGDGDGGGEADNDGRGDDGSDGGTGNARKSDAFHVLSGTPEHPLWSVDRRAWIPIGQLVPGERLLLADGGGEALVERLEEEHAPAGTAFTTYNFEVEDWHSYFAGAEPSAQVWTHNECDGDTIGPKQPRSALGADVSYRDPDPVPYAGGRISPDTPVIDHKRARALRGHPTDPDNLAVRTWSENSRKGWHEGNYLRERRKLMNQGLSEKQAEWVLEDYLRWIESDIHATPVDPRKLDKLSSP